MATVGSPQAVARPRKGLCPERGRESARVQTVLEEALPPQPDCGWRRPHGPGDRAHRGSHAHPLPGGLQDSPSPELSEGDTEAQSGPHGNHRPVLPARVAWVGQSLTGGGRASTSRGGAPHALCRAGPWGAHAGRGEGQEASFGRAGGAGERGGLRPWVRGQELGGRGAAHASAAWRGFLKLRKGGNLSTIDELKCES